MANIALTSTSGSGFAYTDFTQIKGVLQDASYDIKTAGITATSGWLGTSSLAGILGGIPIAYTCEKNAAPSLNDFFSFGSSSTTGYGPAMPFAGSVLYSTLTCRTITGTLTVELCKDGATSGAAYRMAVTSAGAVSSANLLASPLTFNTSQSLNWKVVGTAPTVLTGAVITFFVKYN